MHFLRPARIGETIEMECRVIRETRDLVFVEGSLTANTQTIATAKGIWKIKRHSGDTTQ
jgi:acyl-coenzyme A thioesterase PaaI-like protein